MISKDAGEIQSSVEGFLESLERCTKKKASFDVFYSHLLTGKPEIRAFFANTDIRAQAHVLETSRLLAAAVAIAGSAVKVQELEKRVISHDAHHLNIDPSLYVYWVDALLISAAE